MDREHVKGYADKAKGAIKEGAGKVSVRRGEGLHQERWARFLTEDKHNRIRCSALNIPQNEKSPDFVGAFFSLAG
jgi:hypothetical protein